jgi:hypothetical protein
VRIYIALHIVWSFTNHSQTSHFCRECVFGCQVWIFRMLLQWNSGYSQESKLLFMCSALNYWPFATKTQPLYRMYVMSYIWMFRNIAPVKSEIQPKTHCSSCKDSLIFDQSYANYQQLYETCILYQMCCVKWVPVTTAWHVLRLRMEERPPDMEGSCEYIV